MAEPVLRVENLRIEFAGRGGALVAVDDVSFEVAGGEVLGLVGESGAGKSLTGAAIIGLLRPPGRISAGRIWIGGQRVDDLSPRAMRAIRGKLVGAIFQDPMTSLNPLFTVGQQLVETIRVHDAVSLAEARSRALGLLKDVGIPAPESRFSQYPHQFSGGMRQRVVIALALCVRPKLIIADEPTTALDVSIQAQIIALLKRMGEELGTAIVLVTHDMGVIAETADRVAVMYAGRLAEIGDVRDVIEAPAHPYTRGLMASIPVIGQRHERLFQIEGAMPRLTAIPQGCAFNKRCGLAIDRCFAERPEPRPIGSSKVACWRAGEAMSPEQAA